MDSITEFAINWWIHSTIVLFLLGLAIAACSISAEAARWVDELADPKKPDIGSIGIGGIFWFLGVFLVPAGILFSLAQLQS